MRLVDFEKLLPEDLPAGETVLWHGRPAWRSLARHAFRGNLIAAYFLVMAAWNFASAAYDASLLDGVVAAARTLATGAATLGLLGFLAWLSSRTTLYVITNRRVVMKIGIALPIFLNLPFAEISAASVRVYSDGDGDIPLALGASRRIAYLHLWPHARPFRFANPEPSLRCIRDAANVAALFSRALIQAHNERAAFTAQPTPSQASATGHLTGGVAAA